MSRHLYLALAVAVLPGTACDRSAQVRAPVTTHTDTYAVKEAALTYMIRELAPSEGCRLAITDSEHSERLLAALSGSTAAVFSAPGKWHVENGAYFDSETGLPVVLLSAKIMAMGPRDATVETEADGGFEGGNWYTVHLRKDGADWKVESAELVAHS